MEPEAYQEGWLPFLGLTIWLDSRPLIPRPETEWWTERLLAHVGGRTSHMGFLDLCAGSGAIGCAALKQLPQAEVWFAEVDPAHEATIRKNIRENGLDEARAHICIGDLFEALSPDSPPDGRFDIIAANPPYVPEERVLPAEVAEYEPALALYAGPDGLALIRQIAKGLRERLTKGGTAWVECDAEHAEEACNLFTAQGFAATIMHDQYGRPRIIVVSSS